MADTKKATKKKTASDKTTVPVTQTPGEVIKAEWPISPPSNIERTSRYNYALIAVTVLAFWTRFYRINHPSEVVFDEVHFGKFASYYLRGTYFFDLHPPFAKIMIAMVGKLVGYDGSFLFDTIGVSYTTSGAPFVAYRAWCALLGALVVPTIFQTLREAGLSVASCSLGAALVLFDNAEIAETRLILLDSTLLFTISISIYSYLRFTKQRHIPFSFNWWLWLLTTGACLSLVISTKYIGTFTFLMVGAAVIADLWRLLDIRTGLNINQWSKHFSIRAFGLIFFPFLIFLSWFWLHFELLPNSGPGDNFMSPLFQETLNANPIVENAMNVHYYDTITLRSKVGNFYLHSHASQYPLQYDDGRISSQGQQVTGYSTEDINNQWQILPAVDLSAEDIASGNLPIIGASVVRLRHVATDTYLWTHDVASPSFPTNEEITTVSLEEATGERSDFSLFTIKAVSNPEQGLRTGLTGFRIEHVPTRVAVWMSDTLLPDWGFNQVELNGAKEMEKVGTEWYVDDVVSVQDKESRRTSGKKGEPKTMWFLRKYLELQQTMFESNNNLKDTHPYQSNPISWPFLSRGVSFWTHNESRSQIYFIGNYFSYLLELVGFVVFLGLVLIDQVTTLRRYPLLTPYSRNKLYRTSLWFFFGWACHYFPFFLMGRQLFLHHYMPAHMIGALHTATVVDLVFGQLDQPSNGKAFKTTLAFTMACIGLTYYTFYFFAPLTYGEPLTAEQVQARQWFNSVLHFNK